MKTTSTLVGVVALAAGTVGAAWAYDAAAPPQETAQVAATTPRPAKAVAKRPRLVLAPCRPPAELRKGVCVTDVVRTVVLPAPPAAPAAPTLTAAPPVASAPVPRGPVAQNPPRTHGDAEAEHEDEDEAEHEDAEHEDEDEGDHEDDEREAPEPEGR